MAKNLIKESGWILIRFLINLSRSVDNCLSHEFTQGVVSKRLPKKEKFSLIRKEWIKIVRDPFLKTLYNEAYKNLKKNKNNSVPFNMSIVLMITALENLFEEMFIFLVDNNPSLKKKFLESDKKIDINLLEKYKNNEISFADIVIAMKNFNFQNLESINSAFLWADNKNIYEFFGKLNKQSKIQEIKDVFELRHKIIHEAYNDNSMDFEFVIKRHSIVLNFGIDMFIYIFQNHLIKWDKERSNRSNPQT